MKIAKTFSALSGVLISGFVALQACAGATLTTLVSFNQTNGASPQAGLIQAMDGNFYGATALGGPGGSLTNGTIFQITSSGAFTNLIAFNGTNGAGPSAGLVQGADGNFYGTTYNGGSNNAGTVFELTTNGALTTLATLAFDTGGYPIAGLIQSRDGNFYGTTAFGGTNGLGTIFKLATDGTVTTLVSFDNTNGNSPYAGLVQANDGNLYGTTYYGGTNGGYGTIFRLATNGAFASLVSFNNTNGANPQAGLAQGTDGYLYGTTYAGGTNDGGTVFRFATNGTFTALYSFTAESSNFFGINTNSDGANPTAGLVQSVDGSFYGTTFYGGTNGCGTIFKLTTNGTFTALYAFAAESTNSSGINTNSDGANPTAGLVQGTDGNFYGTTTHGGTNGYGTVFRLTVVVPPPRFKTVTRAGTTVTLTWSATVGESYQMLYKTNLNQAVWSNLNDSLAATNQIMTTFDTAGPDRQRFYRILLLP